MWSDVVNILGHYLTLYHNLFLTRLLTSGILLSAALRAAVVANPVILGISPLIPS